MEYIEQLVKFLIRVLIVGAWVGLIGGVLSITSYQSEESEESSVTTGRVLRILAWGDIFDPVYIRKFEQEMGVTVHMSAYTSNEELIVKLKASKGRGYDLILPSDYAVEILKNEHLLKKMDQKQVASLLERINPLLKYKSYDPNNEYSIPYEWEVYGLAYDKEFFANKPLNRSWSMLFSNPEGAYRVVVSGDSREMVRAAAHYLYGPTDALTLLQQQGVEDLLRKQRSWVEAYTLTNLDYYLISGYGQLAFASSAYIGRRKNFASRIGFFVPREGGLVTIENMAMPIHGENDELVYAFMKFIASPESMLHHFNKYTYFPATQDIADKDMSSVSPEIRALMHMGQDEFDKLIFIKHLMPEERTNDLWVHVKA
jgi:spermidine/putrescine transport system substrate-binding protein